MDTTSTAHAAAKQAPAPQSHYQNEIVLIHFEFVYSAIIDTFIYHYSTFK
jgi:hypothetical protein